MKAATAFALLLAACGGGHSATSGDGGMSVPIPDGGTVCPAAGKPALASGTCEVTKGGANLLITGTILVPGDVLRGGQVAVDATGKITCAACDCSAMAAGATTIDCPTGVVSPGLINPHDHLGYTQDAPGVDSGERYEQRNDWREGERGHTKLTVPGGASVNQIGWGELRFVMGVATSTVGAGGVNGLLRNLDYRTEEGGITHAYTDFDTFPLGDSSGTQLSSGLRVQVRRHGFFHRELRRVRAAHRRGRRRRREQRGAVHHVDRERRRAAHRPDIGVHPLGRPHGGQLQDARDDEDADHLVAALERPALWQHGGRS